MPRMCSVCVNVVRTQSDPRMHKVRTTLNILQPPLIRYICCLVRSYHIHFAESLALIWSNCSLFLILVFYLAQVEKMRGMIAFLYATLLLR